MPPAQPGMMQGQQTMPGQMGGYGQQMPPQQGGGHARGGSGDFAGMGQAAMGGGGMMQGQMPPQQMGGYPGQMPPQQGMMPDGQMGGYGQMPPQQGGMMPQQQGMMPQQPPANDAQGLLQRANDDDGHSGWAFHDTRNTFSGRPRMHGLRGWRGHKARGCSPLGVRVD